MTTDTPPRRRRLDRITDPEYLAGLEDRSTDEIRAMRDECEEEESGISYARRVLQGRLDILRAEVLRRRDAGSPSAASILERLPSILSDVGRRSATQARMTRFLIPPAVRYHRREVDDLADPAVLADLAQRDDDELEGLVGRLADKERQLSQLRRALLDRVDALQSELARRYKSGSAHVSDVLSRP